MIIDCISDLHGHYPELKGGDLLIVAGDLTARDTHGEYLRFYSWLHKQKYKHYIFIAGNHDNLIEKDEVLTRGLAHTTYLCDSGTQFEGLKIWGSPWTKTFPGMNLNCKAFTVDTEEEFAEEWSLIPDDVDILVTHSPPFGILDKTASKERVGSIALRNIVARIQPKLHVFGHIHENGGQDKIITFRSFFSGTMVDHDVRCVNASHVNERYEPVNKPIRVIL